MISLFIDALPYSYISKRYKDNQNIQIAPLLQNVGYSSSLHWELYCDIYPDNNGFFVDWVQENEPSQVICFLSKVLAFTDLCGDLGVYCRKILDRVIFRRNAFANIPFKFRPYFRNKSDYLFWNIKNYGSFDLFKPYCYAMQDEGHKSFEENLQLLRRHIHDGQKNIFGVFGEIDSVGHKFPRGEEYDHLVDVMMNTLFEAFDEYLCKYPDESILIVSDHGMSTISELVDVALDTKFGCQSKKRYIAYNDTAIMCVFCKDDVLRHEIESYLQTFDCGHVLADEERSHYGLTSKKYGDIIFNLKEGYGFKENWFGKSIRKDYDYQVGMHGFWPEWSASDQLASIILINGKMKLDEKYEYKTAYQLINEVMRNE